MPLRDVDVPFRLRHLSVLDEEGHADADLEPDVPEQDLRALYRTMLLVREHDEHRLRLQRQGRIGTFAPVKGQEAAQLGSVYALRPTDWMVPAFRETAAAVWRGMRLEDDLLYAAGREEGVRMDEDARDLPIAIPVGSQIPHAVGLAWARALRGTDDVVLTYFGDGATSEGEFHEAANFATVFRTPVVFLCQNNHWAISVPRTRQTRSPTLAQKAHAYDMRALQVDGNDLLAMIVATREAVARARDEHEPTFLEAITYRLGVHTTADDPTKYRDESEVRLWERRDPLPRVRAYLLRKGLLSEDEDEAWRREVGEEVRRAVRAFEETEEPDPLAMFDHQLAELPPYVARQREELARHLGRGRGREREAEVRP